MNKTFSLAAGVLLAAVAVPSLAQAQNAFTTDLVNLRAGPGFEYPVVFAVPERQPINSYGCLNDWSWCDVTVNGYRGWMAGQYIVYSYNNRYVPVAEYGPRYRVPVVSFNFGTYWDTHYRGRPWYSERTRWERYDRDHRGNVARRDTDRDGVSNNRDKDIDGDGIRNSRDRDIDGDGIRNKWDRDKDGDGVPNKRDRHD